MEDWTWLLVVFAMCVSYLIGVWHERYGKK